MRDRRAAARYAEALFDIARDEDGVEAVRAELVELVRVIEATPELQVLLRRPDLEAERFRRCSASWPTPRPGWCVRRRRRWWR